MTLAHSHSVVQCPSKKHVGEKISLMLSGQLFSHTMIHWFSLVHYYLLDGNIGGVSKEEAINIHKRSAKGRWCIEPWKLYSHKGNHPEARFVSWQKIRRELIDAMDHQRRSKNHEAVKEWWTIQVGEMAHQYARTLPVTVGKTAWRDLHWRNIEP